MADIDKEETKWKNMVAENEITLLKLYAKQDLGLAYKKAERNGCS